MDLPLTLMALKRHTGINSDEKLRQKQACWPKWIQYHSQWSWALTKFKTLFGWLRGIHETYETPSLPPGISHYSFEDIITEYQTNHFFALYLKHINLCSINNIDDLPSRLLSEKITSNCQLSSTYQNSIWKEEMFKEDSLWGMFSNFFFLAIGLSLPMIIHLETLWEIGKSGGTLIEEVKKPLKHLRPSLVPKAFPCGPNALRNAVWKPQV